MSKNVQEPRCLSKIAVVGTFIFLGVIRSALEPTQPPIKTITEGLPAGWNVTRGEALLFPLPHTKFKNACKLLIHVPTCVNTTVLN